MPRKYRHSKAAIHARESTSWDQEPLPAPLLTPEQVRRKRLELAQEMLTLLLGDGELVGGARRTLQHIYVSLEGVRRLL